MNAQPRFFNPQDDDDGSGIDSQAFNKALELVRAAEVAGGSWAEALIWLSRSHDGLRPLADLASSLEATR